MTWTGKTFNVGDILTAAQMNNLQADITAQAQGDAGAPPQAVVTLTTSTEVGSASVAGTYPLPNGLVTISAQGDDGTAAATVEISINGTFRPVADLGGTGSAGGTFLVVNSGDLQVNRSAGTISVYWQRFI
jgi:hypothetical protein